MQTITLSRGQWNIDFSSQLGKKGGFGSVFRGSDIDKQNVAIKQLHDIDPDLAKREISIVDTFIGKKFDNVLEFLDSGYDKKTGFYYIVMPMADFDLNTSINTKGVFTESEVVDIIIQIASGLLEIQELVHRDLKPGNILFHKGAWKIADFGISRFVESTTSLNTLKDFMTSAYAAPEQWLGERTTKATDIYSLGIIAHQLLTGDFPFKGPTYEEFKEQHLKSNCPQILGVSPRLNTIISLMTSKAQNARPILPRLLELLQGIAAASEVKLSPGLASLSEASAIEAEKRAKQEAENAAALSRAEERSQLASSAIEKINRVIGDFFNSIRKAAPIALIENPSFKVKLGSATLIFERLEPTVIPPDAFNRSEWDVITGAYISVSQQTPKKYVWSANLWFTNLGKNEGYRWWEVCYMQSPLSGNRPEFQPFYFRDFESADIAASIGINQFQLAGKPKPIDEDATEEFYNRWAGLLSKAYYGQLEHPRSLPLDY